MKNGNVDLHLHTTASDGSYSPRGIVQYAKKNGLVAVGITDHDDISGLEPAIDEGDKIGVEVLPGVELSTKYKKGTMHILGYMIDPGNESLNDALTDLKNARITRNKKIIEKLTDLGMNITLEEVKEEAKDGSVGRPHFANILLRKDYVGNYYEAFNKYLKKGGPAYVDREKLTIEEAIELIRSASGIPVLAHPHSLKIERRKKLEAFIKPLIEYGLGGLEVYYSRHTKPQTETYKKIARHLDLLITGGSDFHGKNKPGVKIGVGKGNLDLQYHLVENLLSENSS